MFLGLVVPSIDGKPPHLDLIHATGCKHPRLRLLFNLEDGDDMFLRNVVLLSTDYMAFYPRGQNSP
jgi:hypothetical protein